MSVISDLVYFDNPAIWDSFGGNSYGIGGLVWQMFIWSVIVGLLVSTWLIYNLIFFRHKEGDPEPKDALKAGVFPHERGDVKIELTWTIAPLILVSWLTFLSLAPLDYMWDIPDNEDADVTVEVTAGSWYWGFEYANGYEKPEEFTKCSSNINCLEVPANSIIRFNVTSVDNLHAFYLPDMGIKQDAVPGLNTATWVDTGIVSARDEPYRIYCTEYCGNSHSQMLAEIYVTEVNSA